MSPHSAEGAAVHGPGAPEPGPCDLLLIHPYSLSLDDARYYELLPYPPLGLLMIAAVAREMGYRVVIYDGTFSDGLRDLGAFLLAHPPRLVGVGSWNSYRANTRRVIEEVSRAGLPVLAGGPDPSIYPDDYLDAGARLVVIGEGEETLRELLPAMLGPAGGSKFPAVFEPDRLREVAGLAFREASAADGSLETSAAPARHGAGPSGGQAVLALAGSGIARTPARERLDRLEDLPLPAYDLVPTASYLAAWEAKFGYTSLPIMTARGCPFHCTWCARPSFGRVYKQRSVAHVMKELRFLVETLGARYIRIVDDTFVIRKGWIEEWSQAVQASGLDFRYECLARVELLTDPVVEALRKSGCIKVFCGVESGSQRVLDAMKKGTTVEQIESAGRRLRAAGISFHAYLMFGYPGERHCDVRKTMSLLRRVAPNEHSISVAYPMPGTEFYDLVHALMSERAWKNRDDADLQFEADYSPLYYRFARAITRRLYAPGHPSDLRERIEGYVMEVFFFFVRWRDDLTRRREGLSQLAESHVAAPGGDHG